MAKWSYEGLDNTGKKVVGSLDAINDKEVRKKLRTQGVRPRRIIPPSIFEFDIGEFLIDKGFGKPFGPKDLLYFTKQLSTMVNAGVPILQSLEILYSQEPNFSLKKSIRRISTKVSEGQTLADSMKAEKGFSKLYCNLVRAGETGGILDTILDKLTIHMEKIEKIKNQIKSAMTYPAIVVIIGVVIIYGMLYFVVPQFENMLADSGKALPDVTQLLIDISKFLELNTIYLVPGFIALLVFIKYSISTPTGKPIFDAISLKMPIFGSIILKANLSSFSRTLSTLITSGISLVDALEICIDTLDNVIIANDLKLVRKAVIEGKTLTEPLQKIDYFPPMIAQMIKVGEQSGQIDNMLLKVADIFEEEVNHLIENMTKLIEPFILVVLGGFVAFILIAMYMPMFTAAG